MILEQIEMDSDEWQVPLTFEMRQYLGGDWINFLSDSRRHSFFIAAQSNKKKQVMVSTYVTGKWIWQIICQNSYQQQNVPQNVEDGN